MKDVDITKCGETTAGMSQKRATKELYEWAIDNGIAKEQARAVLPEGNTVSQGYM